MQKPPVDIEWYDDGFSMEEQKELKKQHALRKAASRPKIQVTERYHENAKDKIISDLRQRLAANEAYIAELEETKSDAKLQERLDAAINDRDNWKKQYTAINAKYAEVLNNPELGVQKYRDTIKELEQQVKSLTKVRDELIGRLCSQSQN